MLLSCMLYLGIRSEWKRLVEKVTVANFLDEPFYSFSFLFVIVDLYMRC